IHDAKLGPLLAEATSTPAGLATRRLRPSVEHGAPSHAWTRHRRVKVRSPHHSPLSPCPSGMKSGRPARILILGGGFGGIYTALHLERLLARELKDGRVEIGLISRDNYMVFQPMLPEVISGSIGILDTITPIRRLCPGTNLYTRTIQGIDLERRRVWADAGFGSQQCYLYYDHL